MTTLRILIALVSVLSALPAYAQQWDQVNGSMQVKSGPTAPLVIIDQTNVGQKILSLRSNGTEVCYATATAFTCTGGFTFPTSCTGTYTGPFTNGVTSTGSCVNGSAVLTSTSTAVTSTVGVKVTGAGTFTGAGLELVGGANPSLRAYDRTGAAYLPMIYDASSHEFQEGGGGNVRITIDGNAVTLGATTTFGWSDISLSRGAANRLDLATGDSLYLVSGGLGVGVTQTTAGSIHANVLMLAPTHQATEGAGSYSFASTLGGSSRTRVTSPARGQANWEDVVGATVGVGLDFATDAIFKVRTRAQTGYATVDALAYQVSGVAGVTQTCVTPVTAITIVGGIITAVTCP